MTRRSKARRRHLFFGISGAASPFASGISAFGAQRRR